MRSERLKGTKLALAAVVALMAVTVTAEGQGRSGRLSGRVKIDGSSTVAPITMAAAELFAEQQPRVQVTVGISGSGGGFKKFLADRADLRTDISDASRPIKAAERERAEKLGVKYIELPVAYDGIAVVVNKGNTFCKHLTVEELGRIWSPNSKINNWKDVRPGFPDLPLKLYGPGTDSGTFDYFVETVVGKAKACRADFTASEDDNVLVLGVSGDKGGLGYFGYSYYAANKDKLAVVAVSRGDAKPVEPSMKSIADGTYTPLSRPLFMYVNADAAERPEVRAFLKFIFDNAKRIVEHPRVNYVSLGDDMYELIWQRYEERVTGSQYVTPGASQKGLNELYGGGNP